MTERNVCFFLTAGIHKAIKAAAEIAMLAINGKGISDSRAYNAGITTSSKASLNTKILFPIKGRYALNREDIAKVVKILPRTDADNIVQTEPDKDIGTPEITPKKSGGTNNNSNAANNEYRRNAATGIKKPLLKKLRFDSA